MAYVMIEGDTIAVRDDGDVCYLTVDAAAELSEALGDAVASLRRGRMATESWGWCCACGRELVNVAEGYDTCEGCVAGLRRAGRV